MRKKIQYLIVSILLLSSISYSQLQELRGTWITNVDSYVLFNDRSIAEAMDYLASIGINTIFVCTWNKGYTLYPSKVMQERFGIPIWPTFSGRDPLDKIIIEAHRNGIEVIAWFEYGLSPWYAQNPNDSGHIIKKYPHWASLDRNGRFATRESQFPQFIWMSGINPEVQDFMISLFTEVIDKYDVDGVQADDRLPAMAIEGGYDSVTVSIYKAENNGASPPNDFHNSQWKRWRANKLNQFFKRLYDSVKVRGDYLIVSSTPSVYPWGYDNYLQDSKTWVDSGYCDTFMPQLYRYDFSSYLYELNLALSYVPLSKRHIFFPAALMKIGNWLISPSYLFNVIQANRQRNIKGESWFFYEGLRANNNSLGDTLKSTFYSQKALLPYRNGNVWRPQGIVSDDTSASTIRTGRWTTFPAGGHSSGFSMTNDTAYASIEYFVDVPYDAYYHLYVYIVTNTVNTTRARYTVYHHNDSTILFINQMVASNAGWYKLGDFYLTKGRHRILKLDNYGIEPGKYITSDAVLLLLNRKLSPNLIITKTEEDYPSQNLDKDILNSVIAYPNPFNSLTKIRFSISSSIIDENPRTTLKIYDFLGRELATLINDYLPVGDYEVEFQPEQFGLSSGVYFGQLLIGNKKIAFKIIYLK